MKQFCCGDLVPGCRAVFRAVDEPGILTQVATHAHADHGMAVVPVEMVAQVRSLVVELPAGA